MNYFKELQKYGEKTVFEAKLLIIGEAGSGKTTLAKKIKNVNAGLPNEIEDTTRGIEISVHTLPGFGKKQDFTMNIWDFGGQEVYHSTHQFFLSKRSLYILLADGRREENLDYWLQIQELLGKNSPMLILMNKKGPIYQEIPIKDFRSSYPNLKELFTIDLKNEKKKMESLREEISNPM